MSMHEISRNATQQPMFTCSRKLLQIESCLCKVVSNTTEEIRCRRISAWRRSSPCVALLLILGASMHDWAPGQEATVDILATNMVLISPF